MSVSRIFKYILANRVPVDDGVLHLVISGMEADDAITCIDVYDAYGLPPPKALIHCLSNTMTASYILGSFSEKVTPYILEAIEA